MRSASLYDRLGETLPLVPVCITETAWERIGSTLGLIDFGPHRGLVVEPASGTHTWGRRRPIDAVFLDTNWMVLAVVPRLAPWRVALRPRAARVLRLAAGEARRLGLGPGRQLYCLGELEDDQLVAQAWAKEPA